MSADAYVHQGIEKSMVQVLVCGLFGTKPLCDPIMTYDDSWEQTNVKRYEIQNILSRKSHLQNLGISSRAQCVKEIALSWKGPSEGKWNQVL